ncbi:elongation factor Tu [Penaeus vannamei]|uniref:elongation factor Tu n=1 Tax=Penaeus vannamei TaxID=6689 RepID=UPI00387F7EB1
MTLCFAGSQAAYNRFEATIYLLSRSEGGRSRPLTSKYIQQLFSRTWNITCRVDLPDGVEMIMPGDHTKVEVTLQERMVMTGGQSFTIRENNATVATGVVTKVLRSVEIPMKRLDKVDFEKFLN